MKKEKSAASVGGLVIAIATFYFLSMPIFLGLDLRREFVRQRSSNSFTGELKARESLQVLARPALALAESWKPYGLYCRYCIDWTLGRAMKGP